MSLEYITTQFAIDGEFYGAEPWGNGHINDTYCATYRHGGTLSRYIHQRVNLNVFRRPVEMMDNIVRVTSHLRAKHNGNPSRHALTVIPARDGRPYCVDPEGGFWRTFRCIEGARSYETVQSPAQAYEAARAFGEFQRQLADLPPPRLHETIPDFHHTPKRFAALAGAIEADVKNRAAHARAEIEFAMRHEPLCHALINAGLPERVTHNDTKFNNVLLDDETGEGVCVIDLDTVMPGLALYDFGDMVRSATCKAAEDERDLRKVHMELEMFKALARGYWASAGAMLTSSERECLVVSGKLITFEIGIRFLTDYLQGDVYFKVHRDGHNLDRCRTQFKLVESMTAQEPDMHRIVAQLD